MPLIQPYLFPGSQDYVNGINFASAGAGALVETHKGLVCFILLVLMVLEVFDSVILFNNFSENSLLDYYKTHFWIIDHVSTHFYVYNNMI